FFIILSWGGSKKNEAALKFLTYMIAGSALLVAAILFLYFFGAAEKTFDMDLLGKHTYPAWAFAIFLLAFAVKTPLFPFHGWLPDAYSQAPTAGTILLAGILSKAGIYGLLRIGMEFFATTMQEWGLWLF